MSREHNYPPITGNQRTSTEKKNKTDKYRYVHQFTSYVQREKIYLNLDQPADPSQENQRSRAQVPVHINSYLDILHRSEGRLKNNFKKGVYLRPHTRSENFNVFNLFSICH